MLASVSCISPRLTQILSVPPPRVRRRRDPGGMRLVMTRGSSVAGPVRAAPSAAVGRLRILAAEQHHAARIR